MFDRIQYIPVVVGNNNVIVNGDVVVGEEALTRIANQLLRRELDILTKEARERLQAAVNECVDAVINKIDKANLSTKMVEFSNPSTQFAFYAALKGYAISETIEQRELLVDAFIERIQEGWDSAEKMIIDSALDILPKLTPKMLSALGLMQLRHQMTKAPVGLFMNQYFGSLTPLAEQINEMDTLDIEYLKQEKLILPLPGLSKAATLEQCFLSQYDLFFRHPLNDGVYEAYCKKYPVAHEAVTDTPVKSCMMWVDSTNNDRTSFCCTNSKMLKETLIARQQEYIIPHVDKLMEMMPLFTEDEVRAYFIRFSPSWNMVFNLFSSDDITKYILSIAGNYIGGKILARASNNKALPLSDYKHKVSI